MGLRSRLIGVVLTTLMAGCAAKAAPLGPTGLPALNVPEPPTRLVVPPTEQAIVAPVENVPASTSEVRPPRPRDTPPPPRTAAPPPTDPPVVDPPVAPPAPTPVLSTSADTTDLEKRVRDKLAQATADLGQINRLNLGTDARAQYDSATRFIRQSEEALKVKNLVYASQLADKAATMAALLRRLNYP